MPRMSGAEATAALVTGESIEVVSGLPGGHRNPGAPAGHAMG